MRYWLVIAIGVGFLFSVLPNTYAQENIASPLKQVQTGVLPQDVKCKEGFVLILKVNGDPTCVKPTSVSRFLSHGWITLDEFTSIKHLTPPQDKSNVSIQKQNDVEQATVNQNQTDIISNQTIKNTTINMQNHTSIPENPPPTIASNIINPNLQVINLVTPNQTIPINAIITSSKPGSIKIVSVGLSSYPLKVGDTPSFSLTWKNTSNKIFYSLAGCGGSDLGVTIIPEDHVIVTSPIYERTCGSWGVPTGPNQTYTNRAYANPTNMQLNPLGEFLSYSVQDYAITKTGHLDVTMNLYVADEQRNYALTDTVKFNVNAIDNTTKQVLTNNTNFVNVTRIVSTNEINNSANPNLQVINLVTSNQTIPVNAIVTSSKPGAIKIVSIGLSPWYSGKGLEQGYPLKVGDWPPFSLTWKNTSSETFRTLEGPCSSISLLGVTITPEDHVITSAPDHERSCGTESHAVNPNETALNDAYADPPNNLLRNTVGGDVSFGPQYYEITKSGTLNVTMNLYVGYDNGSYALTDTVKFNVNAIDNTTTPKQIPTNNTNFVNVTKITSTNEINNSANPNLQVINLVTPNQTIPINAIVTSSPPGSIKIVSIGLSPYPLKVGDWPHFSLTWKNTSSKTVLAFEGVCSSISLLGATITPEDHVVTSTPDHERSCPNHTIFVNPNETALSYAYANPPNNLLRNTAGGVSFGVQYYEITKPGILNVTMNLYGTNYSLNYTYASTVKFNVNATQ